VRSGRRTAQAGLSRWMLSHVLAYQPFTRVGGQSSHGQIVVSFAVTPSSGPCAPACARRPRNNPAITACLRPRGNE
jgi:hypothetical protein